MGSNLVIEGINDSATKAPQVATEWHPTKNGDLKPENVASKAHRKVWWLCPKGHEWEAPVYSRSAGNGCPICYQNSRQKTN